MQMKLLSIDANRKINRKNSIIVHLIGFQKSNHHKKKQNSEKVHIRNPNQSNREKNNPRKKNWWKIQVYNRSI